MAFHIDFTTLRVFLAVSDTLNVTRAAERVHIAPSAVSKRLTELEDSLGAKLLYRLPRGVELTPAGKALRHHARNILSSVDRLAVDLEDYAKGVKGHVRMMANRSSLVEFLPSDLGEFCRRFPDINLDLQEDNSGPIVKAVEEGRTDLGIFTAASVQTTALATFDYRSDEYVLIVPADHRLAQFECVQFEEALPEYFIGLEEQSAWETSVSTAVAEAKGKLRVRFRLKSMDAICRMVAAGLGITISLAGMFAALNQDMPLKSVRLNESWAKRKLKIAARDTETLPSAARLMLEHLRAASSEERARGELAR